ncbi:isoleucine--tRNA ligase [uncultured Nevskia sp.]|uniref:isoleucine--tRNA ligase n=1 Tax=uncultured Nevskia sp. TaxID=228950 RepID=UPI00345C86F9
MQAGLAVREPKMLEQWEAEGLYAQIDAATASRPDYWFVDGPPYANGDIHIGHAVNKVLKDMIVKAARLDGFYAPFTPGWDCHGLPIDLQVEKKFGKVGDKLNAAEFRAECRKYANEQIARQRVDFKRLGVLADWEKPYLTMQPKFEAEQLRVLSRIVANGHVTRGFKPVHWCLDCGSSLAEAEVEYQDKTSFAIDVGFTSTDSKTLAAVFGTSGGGGDDGPIKFLIWTTTPWTIPANKAISVNAELDYLLVEMGEHGRVIVAEGLLEVCAKRYGVASPSVLGRVKGAALERQTYVHPFDAEAAAKPILCGDHVTLDAGTGLVHTAPAHGVDDYNIGVANNIPVESPLMGTGVYVAGTPVVGGLYVRKVDEPVINALREAAALIHVTKFDHSYPHCWRHKTPLIFRATPQWFMSMDGNGLRQRALAAIGKTEWIPGWGEDRIRGMVGERPDWCISRQRTWGVPMAILVDKRNQTLHPDSAALLKRVADAVEANGLEAWFGSSVGDWISSDAEHYEKCPDTLDVWFDSGSVHQCSFVSVHPDKLDADGLAPQADMYLEGSDQHRGWFQSSLLTSVAMRSRAPYKAVLTHGFTVDEKGNKMSKSLGNVVAPQTVTKTLGADVLRLWVSASDYSGEIAISDNLLKRIADAYRRIRNTVRYLLSNLHGFDPAQHLVAPDRMLSIDRWALSELARTQDEIKAAYAAKQFHQVYQLLHNYCAVDLGSLYLDVLKDRLYTLPEASPARRSAQTVLLHIAEAMTRWIAPILSFTADEIWKLLPGDRAQSVFIQTWYSVPVASSYSVAADDWASLLAAREAVKKELETLRAAGTIGSALDADVAIYADGPALDALAKLGDELRFWFITSDASAQPLSLKPATASVAKLENGQTIWIAATATTADKCGRCWHRRPDVGSHAAHPALCGRCIENIDGIGEVRHHV